MAAALSMKHWGKGRSASETMMSFTTRQPWHPPSPNMLVLLGAKQHRPNITQDKNCMKLLTCQHLAPDLCKWVAGREASQWFHHAALGRWAQTHEWVPAALTAGKCSTLLICKHQVITNLDALSYFNYAIFCRQSIRAAARKEKDNNIQRKFLTEIW